MATGKRTVMFVTYEFPPTGGAGVQRMAKFARFLPEHGWSPVVLAAEHVAGRARDESLSEETRDVTVVRTPARSVNLWVSRTLAFGRGLRDRVRRQGGESGTAGAAALSHAARVSATGRSGRTEQITRLLTIPDFACLWVGPAVRAGVKLGRRAEAEVVFASGPPFSALVVGSRVSRRLGIPLVADFRDAWRDNPGNASYPSTWHRNRALALERSVLGTAVRVTTAHPMAAEIVEMGGPIPTFIPNGFDPADLPVWSPRRGGPLVVTFMGTFYGVNDPLPVFKALQQVREGADEETHDIRLRIVGTWPSYVESVAAELGLEGAVEFQPYLPHREALDVLAASDVGLVVYADLPALRVSTPAKLYEYLAIGLPVLFVGPSEGAAPDLVREARAGLVVRYADQSGIAAALAGFARQKSEGVLGSDLRRAVVARFDRRLQAEALARVLEEATGA